MPIVAVAFATLLAVVLVLRTARDNANRENCAENLHQIGLAIIMYCNDHRGAYPDSFEAIVKTERLTPYALICPASNENAATGATTQAIADQLSAGHLSYIYLGKGLTDVGVKDTTPIACEPLSNHGSGMNVLFSDGHVGWVAAKDIPSVIPKLP